MKNITWKWKYKLQNIGIVQDGKDICCEIFLRKILYVLGNFKQLEFLFNI